VSRMIELIKQSAVPAPVMRSAARGALSLPPSEIIEILVYLSGHALFGEQARLSLAGFDTKSMQQVAGDSQTPVEVLEYLASPKNLRPALLPALLENPLLPQKALLELAQSHSVDVLTMMISSPRVNDDAAVLETLRDNAAVSAALKSQAEARLQGVRGAGELDSAGDLLEIESEVAEYIHEHAEEIAAEQSKAFELTDVSEDEKRELAAQEAAKQKEENSRMSPLKKIAGMEVGARVQLAMKGNREERFILIRDGCKVVSSAVLECPKLTDQEVETFAGMKNVQESVLRGISGKRKFMKLYPVVKALVANPRCPLDVSLALVKNVLVQDLRVLSTNKNVSDTLRKVALKMYKEKAVTK
jgi:hypothetical protein